MGKRKYYFILVILASAVILLFTFSFAVAQEPMTLSDCIRYAIEHNPGLLAVKQDIMSAKAAVATAKSAQLPQLSSSFSFRDYTKLPVIVTSLGEFGMGWKESYDLQLTVTQPLYTWGKITKSIQQAKYQELAAEQSYQQRERDLIYSVKQTFYTVLLSQELVRVNQEAIEVAEAHLKDAESFFRAGTVSNFEVLSAEVAIANAKPDLISAKNGLKIASANLATILGMKEAKSTEITGILSYTSYSMSYDTATSLAFANRPDWKAVLLTEKAMELSIPIAATGNKPTVALTGIHDRQSPELTDSLDSWLNYTEGILSVSWSLYDGWATKSRVASARASYAKTQLQKEQTHLNIRLEVEQAVLNLAAAEETIQSQQKTIEKAKESLRLSQTRYENGVGTHLEVMDAKIALTRAETNYAQGLYDYLIALAQLEKVTGVSIPNSK